MIDLTQPPFNAVGDGLSDCTSAFLNAAKSNNEIVLPPGSYRVNPCLFRDINSVRIHGAGGYATRILLSNPGVAFRFSNSHNITLENLALSAVGALPGSSAIQFDEGSTVGTVSRIKADGFKQSGIRLVGTAASPLSGHKITDCVLLSNECEQLYSTYSNDFWIEDNQFGISGTHPQYGCYLDNSSAGTYEGNYHWNNAVAFKAVNSRYNRICINRFEMSDHEAVVLDTCDHQTISENTIHTNGMAAVNTYDALTAANLTNSIITENDFFDWGGGTAYRYAINLGSGCSLITLRDNRASNFGTGPLINAGGSFDVDEFLVGMPGSTVPAGSTVYLGASGNSATEANVHTLIGARRVLARLYVACAAAPGSGQSFSYTLRKNGADTAAVATISGAASWSAVDTAHPILLAADDFVDLKLITSAGAAVTQHRWKLDLVAY